MVSAVVAAHVEQGGIVATAATAFDGLGFGTEVPPVGCSHTDIPVDEPAEESTVE